MTLNQKEQRRLIVLNQVEKGEMKGREARERAEKIISRMVVGGADITEEQAERLREREIQKASHKFTRMRYHSFLVYFSVIRRLGWVEVTSESERSSIQDNYPDAPDHAYYRLTRAGRQARDDLWSNPQFPLP